MSLRQPTDQDYNALESTLLRLLHNLTSLGHATLEFSNQDVVNEQIQEIVSLLAQLDKERAGLDMQVPREVLHGVDSGQNPDIYTSSLISSIVSLNQAGKAKTVLAEELKTSMEKELAKIWPEDMEKYRQIMAEEGVKNESETGEVAVKAEDGMDVDSG